MSTDLDDLGERIATHAAHLDAATHTLLSDLRVFDTGGGWAQQGARSCAQWLSWRVGWSNGTAREHVRVARALGELPLVDDALRKGELSYCKVRAITRVATSANEALLLEDARFTTGAQLERICRKYAAVLRAARDQPTPGDDHARRYVRRLDLEDGMVKLEAVLHPEEAAAVWAALESVAKSRAQKRETETTTTTTTAEPGVSFEIVDPSATSHPVASRGGAEQRRFDRADALVSIAETVLRGERVDRVPTELVVTIPADTLMQGNTAADPVAVTSDGTCVSAETARRLACDCGVVHVVEDAHGTPLSVGRKTRSIPSAIKRALLCRDKTCRFPGCNNRAFLHGHHLEHWANGGETSLGNLVALCSHHHTFVHEYGYRVVMNPDLEPLFYDPRGRRVLDVPARPSHNGGMKALLERNRHLHVSAETNAPGWDGEPIDYVEVIDDLVRMDNLH